jgi:hypothetical protein
MLSHYAVCHILFIVKQNVAMLSVVAPNKVEFLLTVASFLGSSETPQPQSQILDLS